MKFLNKLIWFLGYLGKRKAKHKKTKKKKNESCIFICSHCGFWNGEGLGTPPNMLGTDFLLSVSQKYLIKETSLSNVFKQIQCGFQTNSYFILCHCQYYKSSKSGKHLHQIVQTTTTSTNILAIILALFE